jgi:hypothetical protein
MNAGVCRPKFAARPQERNAFARDCTLECGRMGNEIPGGRSSRRRSAGNRRSGRQF